MTSDQLMSQMQAELGSGNQCAYDAAARFHRGICGRGGVAAGRLMLTVLGGLAEFERELIRDRTGEGRSRAKARGVRFGRPPKQAHQRQEAFQRLANGETQETSRVPMLSIRQPSGACWGPPAARSPAQASPPCNCEGRSAAQVEIAFVCPLIGVNQAALR
jgi:hypothetical protein